MAWVPSIPKTGSRERGVSRSSSAAATGTLLGTTNMVGGSNSFFDDGQAAGSPLVATGSGTIATISMGIRISNFTAVRFAMYTDSAGVPAVRLGFTGPIADLGDDLLLTGSLLTPVPVVNGTTYWLFMLTTGGTLNMTTTAGSEGFAGKALGAGTTAFPDPWVQTGGFSDPDFTLAIRGDTA